MLTAVHSHNDGLWGCLPTVRPCGPLLDFGDDSPGCCSRPCDGGLAPQLWGACDSAAFAETTWSCVATCGPPASCEQNRTFVGGDAPDAPDARRRDRACFGAACGALPAAIPPSPPPATPRHRNQSHPQMCAGVDASLVARMEAHVRQRLSRHHQKLNRAARRCGLMDGEAVVTIARRHHSPAAPLGLRVTLHMSHSRLKSSGRFRGDGHARTLIEALKAQGAHLRPLLGQRAEHGSEAVRLFFTLSDFTGDGLASPLPHLAFSTSVSSHEEAVPDVTFAHYHAAGALIPPEQPEHGMEHGRREHQTEHMPEDGDQHGRRSRTPESPRLFTWEDLLRALDAPHARARRDERDPAVVWRGTLAAAPRTQSRLPEEQRNRRSYAVANFSSMRKALAEMGLRADVGGRPLNYSAMSRARYHLHIDGTTASNALKFRLAFGGVTLRVRGLNSLGPFVEPQIEWWELLEPPRHGVEWIELDGRLSNALGELGRLQADPERYAAIERNALKYVRRVLSPAAVRCYWIVLLREYAGLYARWREACPRESNETDRRLLSSRLTASLNLAGARLPHCYSLGSSPCFRMWRPPGEGEAAEQWWPEPADAANISAFVHDVVYDL